MNSFQVQVLDFTYGFPPAYALTKSVVNVNYRKHFHNCMDVIENVIVFLIAVGIVLRQKWNEYDCTERVQLFALQVKEFSLTSYQWVRNVGIPNFKNAVGATHNAGVRTRYFYNLITSPLFITL